MHELHRLLACVVLHGLATDFAVAFNPSSLPAQHSTGVSTHTRWQPVVLRVPTAILENPDQLASPRPFDTAVTLPVMDGGGASYQYPDKLALPRPFDTAFALPVMDGGVFLTVHLPIDDSSVASTLPVEELHHRELEVFGGMKPHRQTSFAGGRIALRRALRAAGETAFANKPVLSASSGAPAVPSGIVGSISHTHGVAAAFILPLRVLGDECVAHNSINQFDLGSERKRCAVGVDIERVDRKLPLKLARKTLSKEEIQTLGLIEGLSAESDLLLRISIKESLYKAMHPLVGKAIRWHSVQIQPGPDGSCTVDSTELDQEVGKTLETNVRWGSHHGYFWSVATCVAHP